MRHPWPPVGWFVLHATKGSLLEETKWRGNGTRLAVTSLFVEEGHIHCNCQSNQASQMTSLYVHPHQPQSLDPSILTSSPGSSHGILPVDPRIILDGVASAHLGPKEAHGRSITEVPSPVRNGVRWSCCPRNTLPRTHSDLLREEKPIMNYFWLGLGALS